VSTPSVGSVTGAVTGAASSAGSSVTGTAAGATGAGGATGALGGGSAGTLGGGSGGAAGGPSGSSGGSAGSGSGAGSRSNATGNGRSTANIATFHASRPWLSAHGSKGQRRTVLVYRLLRGGRVVFTVRQVSPDCFVVGRFAVHGHAGTNRTPFRGRIHGKQLSPGTYQITAYTPRDGKVARFTFVVVESGVPSPAAVAAARQQNVCAMRALASTLSFGGISAKRSSLAVTMQASAPPEQSEIVRNQQPQAAASDDHSGMGVFAPGGVANAASNPLVIAALAAAVALLGLAALPRGAVPDPRLNDLLARHRGEVALAGTGALVAAVVAMLLS